MKQVISKKIHNFHSFLNQLDSVALLIARLAIGWVFLWAGFGKLGNLEPVIGYFESLGVPFASVQAPIVAALELLGGLALILGFATRYFSAILAGIMGVAILTAHIGDISKFSDVLKIYEFVYILIFMIFISLGAGKLSIDKLISKS